MKHFKLPPDEYIVPRFNKTERAVHWLTSIFYITLLITGFSFSIPSFRFLAFGNPEIIFVFHSVVGLGLGAVILFLYFSRINKYPLAAWKRHFSYLRSYKYNAGQKVNITLASSFLIIFMLSGTALVLKSYLPEAAIKLAFMIHNYGSFIMLFMISGHLFLSTIFPLTNRSLIGMIIGKIDERYARHHHPEWYGEITSEKRSDKSPPRGIQKTDK